MGQAPSENLRCQVTNELLWAETSHTCCCILLLREKCALCKPMGQKEHKEASAWISQPASFPLMMWLYILPTLL